MKSEQTSPETREMQQQFTEAQKDKERLLCRLVEVADQQKALVSQVRATDKREKEILQDVEEHIASEPLSHEDVVLWVESVHAQFARTMAANPHSYIHTRWCDREMFERVVRHIREHGYTQRYGSADYICYDAGDRFFWTMGSSLEDTILINCKPLSMKPAQPD